MFASFLLRQSVLLVWAGRAQTGLSSIFLQKAAAVVAENDSA